MGPCDGTWWVREERMDYVSCVEVSSDIEMIPYLKKSIDRITRQNSINLNGRFRLGLDISILESIMALNGNLQKKRGAI